MVSSKSYAVLTQKFFEEDMPGTVRKLLGLETDDAVRILTALPEHLLGEVLPYLTADLAAPLFERLPSGTFARVALRLRPHQCAALFMTLPEELKSRLVESLPARIRSEVRELLEFPENSAGRLMRTDFISLPPHLTIREATKKIREIAKRTSPPSYVYIVSQERHLIGVITMRDLLVTPGNATIESIVRTDVFAVDAFMDREELANILSEKKYFAVPVVDGQKKLLGVVRTEQLISGVQEEVSEDLLKMFGAGANERSFSPVSLSLKKRLPWLHVNLATAFLAASVVGLFEETIARITILAVFLPVVAGQGGNAGAQSLAVVMRGLVMRDIPRERVGYLIFKESVIGILNGVVIGLVTAGIAWAWHGSPYLGIVIGLAMIVNLLAAGFSGAAIPIAMKAIGFDPAQSSSIILTTVTDVIGFFSFLGFAVLFETHLL